MHNENSKNQKGGITLEHLDRSMVKTATDQNGDTKTATEMAIFKTATNPNNTYAVLVKPI